MLELYTDYLLSSFGATTATGLSSTVEGAVSHDQVTRFLSREDYDSKTLWEQVKPMVRAIEQPDGVLIFDDTIEEKPYTDENELISWHFDHSKNRSVKGINLLNCMYYAGGAAVPVAYELIRKPLVYRDEKTGRHKRKSEVTKNELMRRMLRVCQRNQLQYRYVLADSWFSAKENLDFIRWELDQHFIVALKSNGTAALSYEGKLQGNFSRIDSLDLSEHQAVQCWLRGWNSRSGSFAKSLQTRMAAQGHCIWPQAIWTAMDNPSARSTRNGGKWRPFIRRSSPMPPWPSRLPGRSAPRATTVSCPSMRPSGWKDSG